MKNHAPKFQDPADFKIPENIKSLNNHSSRVERRSLGKQLRTDCPRTHHATWKVPPSRPEPVDLIMESDQGRIPKLIPLRHGRMARSPFTFYRGAALNMASDLALTPVSGMHVQVCGDAHLCNFGGFATPERNVIFSINDLDETLPAPWEWDLKRLATSFVVASRDRNLKESVAREAVLSCVSSYRKHMAEFSEMRTMELWHFSLGAEMMIAKLKDPKIRQRITQRLTKERGRSIAEEIFPRVANDLHGSKFIKDELPAIFHWEGHSPGEVAPEIKDAFALYRESLPRPMVPSSIGMC